MKSLPKAAADRPAVARCCAALLLSCAATAVAAQEDRAAEVASRPSNAVHAKVAVPPVADSAPVYPAAFFAPFQPQTALDMLERTPGFALSQGSFARGFGGAAGNVLIDGQRPTIKVGGISEVLRRIPAGRVERIALLRGGDAAEAQGQSLVANVVLKAGQGGSGTATVGLSHDSWGGVSPSGRVSYARQLGGWQTSVEVSAESVRYPARAQYQRRDGSGTLIQSRDERTLGKAPEVGLGGSASRRLGGGTLTLNTRLGYDVYKSREFTRLYPGDFALPSSGDRRIAYRESGYFGEFGADWTRLLGKDWSAKIVGLGRLQRDTTDEDYAEPGYRGVSAQHEKPLEAVLRTTISREGTHRLRPELGMEIAWNALTSRLDYAEDRGDGLTPITLSGADTRVNELRGEAFANLRTTLSRRWALETSAAVELSRIRVSGDAARSQTLAYLKPSAALNWTPSASSEVRLGFRRTVDQLDFSDFAASVDQADGRELGGNSGLRPARITRGFLRVDHRWGKGGALSAELFHQWHRGLLGYIQLASGEQALGTIGNARQWGLTAQATLPLTALISGGQIKLDGTLRSSRAKDTLLGGTRRIDDLPNHALTAEFRQDVPRLKSAWGVRVEAGQSGYLLFINERLEWQSPPIWTAYIETTALAGIKATLTAEAIGRRDGKRLRTFSTPVRGGTPAGEEARRIREGTVISLSLTRSL